MLYVMIDKQCAVLSNLIIPQNLEISLLGFSTMLSPRTTTALSQPETTHQHGKIPRS